MIQRNKEFYIKGANAALQDEEMKEAIRQENQKKKEYLKGYKTAIKREKRILDQIQKLRMDEMMPAMKYDDMPHGSNISDLSDYAVKMDELLEELRQERMEAITQYTKIYQQIKQVKDERERELLSYRYLQDKRWEEICGIMNISWKHIHRIHGESLKKFKMT